MHNKTMQQREKQSQQPLGRQDPWWFRVVKVGAGFAVKCLGSGFGSGAMRQVWPHLQPAVEGLITQHLPHIPGLFS